MYELLSGLQQSCQHVVSDSDRQARKEKKKKRQQNINVKNTPFYTVSVVSGIGVSLTVLTFLRLLVSMWQQILTAYDILASGQPRH